MILITHIIIALSSMVMTTALVFWPTRLKRNLSAALIALTLASGTYLVISTHSPLLSSCLTGLAYLAVAVSGLCVGLYRLARENI